MSDYTLYYWPLAFRGQFLRAVMAHVGASWTEPAMEDVAELKEADLPDQPVPFIGPPVLIDEATGSAISQMGACLAYLGMRHGLWPDAPDAAALTLKIMGDANDVLDEMTRFGGRSMWAREEWEPFAEYRLRRWMALFEDIGRRHGLSAADGHMLGTDASGLADLVTATLWFTMTDKLPELAPMLEEHAPTVAALSRRIMTTPALDAMRADTDERFGKAWCGGQIEASLRDMLAGPA